MRGITIKLPEETLRRLQQEARKAGRTVAALVRERVDNLQVAPLFQMLERNALRLEFSVSTHWRRLQTLMRRYRRMDLADACVVAMTEQHGRCQVLTLDRTDFTVYRRNDRQVVAPLRR
jgi:predicted nucleic acid-binding protein